MAGAGGTMGLSPADVAGAPLPTTQVSVYPISIWCVMPLDVWTAVHFVDTSPAMTGPVPVFLAQLSSPGHCVNLTLSGPQVQPKLELVFSTPSLLV